MIAASGTARGLVSALGELGFYASLAFGLEEGVARAFSERPDVTLLEWAELSNGVEAAVPQIGRLARSTSVLILGQGIIAPGVAMEIDWPDDPSAVAARVKAVIARRDQLARNEETALVLTQTDLLIVGELCVDRRALQAYIGLRNAQLTLKEFRILEALALAAGSPISRSELRRCCGIATDRSVTTLVVRIRAKLKAAGAMGALLQRSARGGYYLSAEE